MDVGHGPIAGDAEIGPLGAPDPRDLAPADQKLDAFSGAPNGSKDYAHDLSLPDPLS
jgi:hypothetical protein